MDKRIRDPMEVVSKIPDGAAIMVGGFGLCGIPENLIRALRDSGAKGLTIISNNAGAAGTGLALLLQTRQIRRVIGTYVGDNKIFEEQLLKGEVEAELIPQGTFSERIRAGGAGIGGFYTRAGVGTVIAEGKEHRIIGGKEYILEAPLHADFALVKAWKGDWWGNLVYRKAARNFNPMMATAADCTIAEVEILVKPGEIPPDEVHTPGIYVKHIFQGAFYEKRIEKRANRQAGGAGA